MEEILKDMRILHFGILGLQTIKFCKVVLTVAIIVFSAFEAANLVKNQTAAHKKKSLFFLN